MAQLDIHKSPPTASDGFVRTTLVPSSLLAQAQEKVRSLNAIAAIMVMAEDASSDASRLLQHPGGVPAIINAMTSLFYRESGELVQLLENMVCS
jgi:hypothetical protein